MTGTTPTPSYRMAWGVVALLSLLYAFSFIDRLILNLLITPIKGELGISDTQIGVLFGLSFALLYTLAGLPLARIADRGNRRLLIFCGVVFWSLSTVASAFAWDFSSLLVCRAGVAIGEAVLTPTAISMIADLFPREKRGAPTGVYTATGTVTGMAAAAIGGLVLALATMLSPAFEGVAPWRLTLILVGAPGLLAAVAFFALVREPARKELAVAADNGALMIHLKGHWPFYAPFFAAVGLSAAVGYAMIGWAPTLLVRKFTMEPSHAGYLFGIVGVLSGLVGTLGTPVMVARASANGRRDGLLLAGVGMAVVGTPAVLVATLAPTLVVFTVALAIAFAAMPGLTLLPSLAVQQVTPPRQRAQVMAVYLLIANLLGLGVGPTVAGLLSDTVFHDNGGMGAALATVAGVALPLCIILLLLSRKAYKHLQDEAALAGAI